MPSSGWWEDCMHVVCRHSAGKTPLHMNEWNKAQTQRHRKTRLGGHYLCVCISPEANSSLTFLMSLYTLPEYFHFLGFTAEELVVLVINLVCMAISWTCVYGASHGLYIYGLKERVQRGFPQRRWHHPCHLPFVVLRSLAGKQPGTWRHPSFLSGLQSVTAHLAKEGS